MIQRTAIRDKGLPAVPSAPGGRAGWPELPSRTEPLPPGSYLVMGHAASDIAADFMAAGAAAYNDRVTAQITPRDLAGVSRFFDGLEMIGPGVVPLAQWFGASGDRGLQAYCGVGRKL